jgi:hypothetical protein
MNYHITHAPIGTSTKKKSFGTVASRMHLKMTTEVSQLQTEEHPVTQRDAIDVKHKVMLSKLCNRLT